MKMDAIILAGGLGTRLRSVVGELPKCMAPVNNYPFLHYLFLQLANNGIQHVVLSLGYKHELIEDWINKNRFKFSLSYVVENEPLGTGGAIKAALDKVQTQEVLILNGDTYFDIDVERFHTFHTQHEATLSVALKPMNNFERYGNVSLNDTGKIVKFHEKEYCSSGYINGGCYILNTDASLVKNIQLSTFSFEKEVLEKGIIDDKIYGFINDHYFIDIGVPEDYMKANEDFKTLFR